MTKSKLPTLPSPASLREPTAPEVTAIERATAAQTVRPARATLDVHRKDNNRVISNPHTQGQGWWATVMETFGTASEEFTNDSISKLSSVLERCDGDPHGLALNSALALIGGITPQDEAQAAIAVQIAVTHAASIHMTSKALSNANAGHVEVAASFAGIATKLSRTMVAHVEALTKLRGGGRQVIEHRYINVNGNAVVGDNAQGLFGGPPQGVENGNQHQPHERLDSLRQPLAALPCLQQGWDPLPVASDEGAEALPSTRGPESRRAHGGG